MNRSETVIATIFGAVMLFGIMFLVADYGSCKDQGGQYVRGIFWMECIK